MDRLEENIQKERYESALKQVKKLKGFYTHLAIFIAINIMILGVNMYYTNSSESIFRLRNFSTVFFWGIGLIAHAISVFIPRFGFGKKWEEEKIKKIMERNRKNEI
jgi:H+/gluconate symporter-like permease